MLFPEPFPVQEAEKLLTALVFVLGCCIGSFMNVVIWRLPRGEKLCYPGSHCPNCNHAIRPWENIPILSWLCLRGRCSSCRKPISIRYPLGEAACGLLYVFVFKSVLHRQLPLECLPPLFFVSGAFLAAAWIDVKHRIIPDKINYSGMVVSGLLALWLPLGRYWLFPSDIPLPSHAILFHPLQQLLSLQSPRAIAIGDWTIGLLCGYLLLWLFRWSCNTIGRFLTRKKDFQSIGLGDVKFLAMAGSFFGADVVIYTTLIGAFLGTLWAIGSLPFKKRIPAALPFGPFLALACWLLMLLIF